MDIFEHSPLAAEKMRTAGDVEKNSIRCVEGGIGRVMLAPACKALKIDKSCFFLARRCLQGRDERSRVGKKMALGKPKSSGVGSNRAKARAAASALGQGERNACVRAARLCFTMRAKIAVCLPTF